MPDHEQLFIESAEELRSWLEKNHPQKESVWLVRWKKAFTNSYLDYDSIVDELVCYGWVDSLPRALDEKKPCSEFRPVILRVIGRA